MIPKKIKAVFEFINFLHAKTKAFKEYVPIVDECLNLGKEMALLKPDDSYKDNKKFKELEAIRNPKLDIVRLNVEDVITEQALSFDICNKTRYGIDFNWGFEEIRQLQQEVTEDDLPTIIEHKNLYLGFRNETNCHFLSFHIFFNDLERYLKSLFSYFDSEAVNEFEKLENRAFPNKENTEAKKQEAQEIENVRAYLDGGSLYSYEGFKTSMEDSSSKKYFINLISDWVEGQKKYIEENGLQEVSKGLDFLFSTYLGNIFTIYKHAFKYRENDSVEDMKQIARKRTRFDCLMNEKTDHFIANLKSEKVKGNYKLILDRKDYILGLSTNLEAYLKNASINFNKSPFVDIFRVSKEKIQNCISFEEIKFLATLKGKAEIGNKEPQPISINESRTKEVINETLANMDKQGWEYAFVSEQDYNSFTDLLTNFFEYKSYSLPETTIQLKRSCKTKVAKALGEIHKELSNENKLSTDAEYFDLIRILNHFEKETEGDLYKALTR